jgi:hypothetical protein
MFVILHLSLPDPQTLTVPPPLCRPSWLELTGPALPPCATRLMRSMVRFSRRSSSWCVVCVRVEEAHVDTRKTFACQTCISLLAQDSTPKLSAWVLCLNHPHARSDLSCGPCRPDWAAQQAVQLLRHKPVGCILPNVRPVLRADGRLPLNVPLRCVRGLPSLALLRGGIICIRLSSCVCVCARFVAWRCDARACRAARSCERGCSARRPVEARERMQL